LASFFFFLSFCSFFFSCSDWSSTLTHTHVQAIALFFFPVNHSKIRPGGPTKPTFAQRLPLGLAIAQR
jgi:hypothetical protein